MADHRTVAVELGADSYPIHIGPGLLDRVGELVRPHLGSERALIVADAQVAAHHGARLVAALAAGGVRAELATFPAGETSKSLATAEQLWQACAERRIDRGDAIIALGGGVSGDLAGYVAACWMRGIRFVQVPTSLLAMVDSSVGGKTGVNSAAGKNLVGAFKQPVCVVIDPTLVASMDGREYRAGLAEVLKYGVIIDPGFFAWQEANADALVAGEPAAVAHAVAESCRIKAWYVAQDPHERGVRAHLNYGHTFGHALERETRYTRYLHGEAVAIGMRMAANLAQRIGLLPDYDLARRQDALLTRFRLPTTHISADPLAEIPRLVGHCRLDKKVQGGRMRFVLPTRLGAVETTEAPAEADVAAAFRHAITGG
jgi:3-dehydroquinate synthase